MKRTVYLMIVLGLFSMMLPVPSNATDYTLMNNFCITPPFIQQSIQPNLLLMIDNSSSMYDLAYADEGYKSGSLTREPSYCYDKTYTSTNTYVGYFDRRSYYVYDFTNKYFSPSPTLPLPNQCDNYISNTLCVAFDSSVIPNKVSTFAASGNYLNWLTASKFDVEKQVLTGGKYVNKVCSNDSNKPCISNNDCGLFNSCNAVNNPFLMPESRGCLGQSFIKDALNSDFVNYVDPTSDNNIQLGVTFSIRGPVDSSNPSAPSRGGQTIIEIYRGKFNSQNCQSAVDIWGKAGTQQGDVTDAVNLCLNYNPKGTNYCSGSPSIACTIDSNCVFPGNTAKAGGCSNNSSTSCNADSDCGTTTNPGICKYSSFVPGSYSCTNSSDCTINSAGSCSNQSKACVVSSECTIAPVYGICSNQAKQCSQSGDCTIPTVMGTCSTGVNRSCSSNSDCPAIQGHCSKIKGQAYDVCSSDADCGTSNDPSKYGTCSNPAPVQSGTCQGYAAQKNGSCNGYVSGSTGTCGGGIAITGICSDIITTPNTCNNPAPLAASTINLGPCINPDQSTQTKTKISYHDTIQTCWTYWSKAGLSSGDYTRVTNACDNVLAGWGICSLDESKICAADAECSANGLGSCLHGPTAIRPGNPALVCGNAHVGQFCNWNGTNCNWTKYNDNSSSIDTVISQFCDALQPTVIDPTDSATTSPNIETVPSLLTGIGLEAQLGQPLGTMLAKVGTITPPSGLIQQFGGQIRIGAMTFNQFGSATEAKSSAVITLPRVCSNDGTRLCSMDVDCSGGTCGAAGASQNLDGAKIIYPAGYGFCAIMTQASCSSDANCSGQSCLNGFCGSKTNTPCTIDLNCGANQNCIANSVGGHVTAGSLVNILDGIRANSWTPFSEAFYEAIGYFAYTNNGQSRTDMRLNSYNTTSTDFTGSTPPPLDYNEKLNPSQYSCQSNYILLVSDGSSTADQNPAVFGINGLAKYYNDASHANLTEGACSNYLGSQNLPIMSWIAKNMKISNFSLTSQSAVPDPTTLDNRDTITTYVVYNGGSNGQAGACDAATLLSNTATKGGTKLYQASNPAELYAQLYKVFNELSSKASSGTAASILSNSEGSGATLMQALFYPKKNYDKLLSNDLSPTSAIWTGELQSFWYYIDPKLNNSTIREDTDGDFKLNLKNDKITQLYFDKSKKQTLANKYSDSNGDGLADSNLPDAGAAGISPDMVNSLWKAGKKLWSRNLINDPRLIYTGYNSTRGLEPQIFDNLSFNTSSSTGVWDVLQVPGVNRNATAAKLVNYVVGTDQGADSAPCLTSDCTYRSRRVYISGCDAPANSGYGCKYLPTKACTQDSDCLLEEGASCVNLASQPSPGAPFPNDLYRCTREWKLADIVSSTPKIASNIRVNNYDLLQPSGYSDSTYSRFINDANYKIRGMGFVGANDGMLHAFKLGVLKELNSGSNKSQINNPNGTIATSASDLGHEEWAFIPTHTLPYLKYLAEPNYNHLFYVDKSPLIVDASIGRPDGCTADTWECDKKADGSTWRTILIGGAGIGGAGRIQGASHDTVFPPIATVGLSSYFALDITNPAIPKYMWESTGNNLLGFATTGVSVIRVSAKKKNADNTYSTTPDHTKNGKWFAVFASGPLGPIDTNSHSFKGQSDQKLRIFVVELETGTLLRTIDSFPDGTPLPLDAFAGSLSTGIIDTDRYNNNSDGFYSDDALYIGYVQKDSATNTWTKGGVLRLLTQESTKPSDWRVSTVIDGIGPVTTSVTKLQDRVNNTLWLYFGTGRFFYKNDDSSNTQQYLYGVKEPCYSTVTRTMRLAGTGPRNDLEQLCTDSVNDFANGPLVDQSGYGSAPATTLAPSAGGWKIQLDPKDTAAGFLTERMITDPLAAKNGAVLFTTFKPSTDPCLFGGNTWLWAVSYNSGANPPPAAMKGKALIQVSTGAFKEITLSDAFINPGSTRYDGRRLTDPITGVPPLAQGLSLFSPPGPTKKIIHIREK